MKNVFCRNIGMYILLYVRRMSMNVTHKYSTINPYRKKNIYNISPVKVSVPFVSEIPIHAENSFRNPQRVIRIYTSAHSDLRPVRKNVQLFPAAFSDSRS